MTSGISSCVDVNDICSEILRVIDSLKLTAKKKVATPVDWKVTMFLDHI